MRDYSGERANNPVDNWKAYCRRKLSAACRRIERTGKRKARQAWRKMVDAALKGLATA